MTEPKVGYWGETRKGKQHGEGTQVYANGDCYKGTWVDGKIEGKGTYTYAAGGAYSGDFKDQRRHGHGVFRSANGDVYTGQWRDGKKTGNGVLQYEGPDSGVVYTGEFRENQKSGSGAIQYKNGDTYVGSWLKDLKQGKGCFKYFANNASYEGGWEADRPHGEGVYTCSDGKRFEGTFIDGKIVSIDVALELKQHLESLADAEADKETPGSPGFEIGLVPNDPVVKACFKAKQILQDLKPSFGMAIANFERHGTPVLRVVTVKENSPAAVWGVRKSDDVLSINSIPVYAKTEFFTAITKIRPGDQTTLVVRRQGEEEPISAPIIAATTLSRKTHNFLTNVTLGHWSGSPEEVNFINSIKPLSSIADDWIL